MTWEKFQKQESKILHNFNAVFGLTITSKYHSTLGESLSFRRVQNVSRIERGKKATQLLAIYSFTSRGQDLLLGRSVWLSSHRANTVSMKHAIDSLNAGKLTETWP